jgi:ATP-dependent DNA helicase RecG
VERPEQQIRDLIAAGEGKWIEFKGNLDDRDDFIESVIAFSNSEGGLILVGIGNNRIPTGFKGDKDAIIKTIRDSCEPLVEPTFREYELDGYPILSIEINSGLDKPYVMKHKGVVYVRIGPNDVPASRLELDQLYQGRNNPPPRQSGLVS